MSAVPNIRPWYISKHADQQSLSHTGVGRYPRSREGGEPLRAWAPAYAGVAYMRPVAMSDCA